MTYLNHNIYNHDIIIWPCLDLGSLSTELDLQSPLFFISIPFLLFLPISILIKIYIDHDIIKYFNIYDLFFIYLLLTIFF
jgi:hypothetical protein